MVFLTFTTWNVCVIYIVSLAEFEAAGDFKNS
jgi:hypothetical protein